jgi:hypothetical protein
MGHCSGCERTGRLKKASSDLVIRSFAAVILAAAQIAPWQAVAETFRGVVVHADGSAGAYLRVDVSGPQKLVTVTNGNGEFTIDAPNGQYRIRITDSRRQMESSVNIPQSGIVPREFRLQW